MPQTQFKSLQVRPSTSPVNRRNSVLCSVIFSIATLSTLPAVQAQKGGSSPTSAPVFAEAVREQDAVISHTFVGTVIPTRTSVVGSMVEGQVIEYRALEGSFVKKGEVLARLRPIKLEIQLAGAKASLELLRSQLEDLSVSLPIEIEQAKARKKAADALQEYASGQYERGKSLGSNTPVSAAELDELKSSATSAINVFGERAAALELS